MIPKWNLLPKSVISSCTTSFKTRIKKLFLGNNLILHNCLVECPYFIYFVTIIHLFCFAGIGGP